MAALEASRILAAIVASGREAFVRDGQVVVTGPAVCATDLAVLRAARPELLGVLLRATDLESDATQTIPLAYPSSSAEMGQDSGLGGVH